MSGWYSVSSPQHILKCGESPKVWMVWHQRIFHKATSTYLWWYDHQKFPFSKLGGPRWVSFVHQLSRCPFLDLFGWLQQKNKSHIPSNYLTFPRVCSSSSACRNNFLSSDLKTCNSKPWTVGPFWSYFSIWIPRLYNILYISYRSISKAGRSQLAKVWQSVFVSWMILHLKIAKDPSLRSTFKGSSDGEVNPKHPPETPQVLGGSWSASTFDGLSPWGVRLWKNMSKSNWIIFLQISGWKFHSFLFRNQHLRNQIP